MDRISTEQRSKLMAKIRSRDTLPEIIVRKRLFSCGWRYRVCDKRFPGRPDIVIPKAKAIIDVRGCFWHRHGCKDSTMPKSNVAFWMQKWSKNVKRDHRNEKAWLDAGWNLIVVWECALKDEHADRILDSICAKLLSWADSRQQGILPRPSQRKLEFPKIVKR